MALSKATLKSALQSLFAGPGATRAECAGQWADAIEAYAAGVVPASTAVAAAAATLETALASAFAGTVAATTASSLETAFAAFATTVAGGMAAAGFTGVPPAGAVGFSGLFAPPFPATHADAAQDFADAIHAWMTSGTATLVSPPNTVVPWS